MEPCVIEENKKELSNQPLSSITVGHGCKVTISDIKSFISKKTMIQISSESYPLMDQSYQFLKSYVDKRIPIYGVNTNFGDQVSLLDEHIQNKDNEIYQQSIRHRQENIIKSLACGLGALIDPNIIKITMLLRAHCLTQGYSAVSKEMIQTLIAYLNADIIPVVRCYGSIGASGDLIPLSMIAAGLLGENVDVHYQHNIIKAPEAIRSAQLTKLNPKLRDGLALINGTSFMTAIAGLSLYELKRLYRQMLAAIAMTLESMLVISSAYHPLVHQLKNHAGEIIVSEYFLNFWKGSQLISDLDEIRANASSQRKSVQDYYSLRAVPQGFGTFHESLEQATVWIENEMNSVNDNPIIDPIEQKIHHNANFMGYYITSACDQLKMHIAQASTWIHALLANLLHPRKNQQLPTNLVENPAKHNGFRSLQLLAAALAVQNRKLAHNQQSFMLPTEGDNQDVNSLGTHAALDFQEAVNNLERLTAILFITAAQALEMRGIQKASTQAQALFKIIREHIPMLVECHPMQDELAQMIDLLQSEKISC